MKKPIPEGQGLAITESLYSFDKSNETDSNIATPPENSNIFGPPSLTPGVQYPITEAEERIRQLAYSQGNSDCMRMNRAGHLVEDDPFLDIMRKRVEQIRKEEIKKGRIKPATKEERKWRLGL